MMIANRSCRGGGGNSLTQLFLWRSACLPSGYGPFLSAAKKEMFINAASCLVINPAGFSLRFAVYIVTESTSYAVHQYILAS